MAPDAGGGAVAFLFDVEQFGTEEHARVGVAAQPAEQQRRDLRLLEVRATAGLIEAMRDAAVGRSGPDAVRAIATAYRRWAGAHPGRYTATLRAPDATNPEAVAVAERAVGVFLAALAAFNLADDRAVDATRMVRAVLHGFVSLEGNGGFGMPRDIDRTFDAIVEAQITALERWAT